jgi:hypothetical protein
MFLWKVRELGDTTQSTEEEEAFVGKKETWENDTETTNK